MPTDELPTRQRAPVMRRRKSSGARFLKKYTCGMSRVSRKCRIPFEMRSEPASTFGQNQKVGRSSAFTASSVSVTWPSASRYSVVTGCCMTTR